MAEGIRATPTIACTTSSLRNRSRCAKRRPPVSTVANKANAMSSTGIWLGEVRPSGNACAKHLAHSALLQVSHYRYQLTPAADRFARITHFQAGRCPPKSATLPLHRPVPPPGSSLRLTTQRYQRSSSGRCASHSLKLIFLGSVRSDFLQQLACVGHGPSLLAPRMVKSLRIWLANAARAKR